MAQGKRSIIRWNERTEKEFLRSIKNFNQKVSRLEKDDRYQGFQPEKIRTKEMREVLQNGTRQDFNRYMRSVNRYTKNRSSQQKTETTKGVVVSKWEMSEYKKAVNRVNKQLAERHKQYGDIKPTAGGKEVPMNRKVLGSEFMERFRPLQTDENRFYYRKAFRRASAAAQKMGKDLYWNQRAEQYKENYLNALKSAFNSLSDDLVAKLNEVDAERFEQTLENDVDGDIDFIYSPLEMGKRISNIYTIFDLEMDDETTLELQQLEDEELNI